MLYTILNRFKTVIEEHVLQFEGELNNRVDVQYVRIGNNSEGSLYPDAINISLFGSVAEKDLLGTYKYSTPTTGNNAMNEKPPLKVAIDSLLLFNFSHYPTALQSYDQVLSYFYNNDLLYVTDEGDGKNEVQVLLSRFNDLDEIEIWSSFNTPGIPMLRYELKYAIVPGRFEELPMIKEITTTEGILHDGEISTLIMGKVYLPIDKILNKVLQKTTSFCSIAVPKTKEQLDLLTPEEKDALERKIKQRYSELLPSYTNAMVSIAAFFMDLTIKIEEGLISKKDFEPFLPSFLGLELKTIKYQKELSKESPTLDNYYEVCAMAKEKIEGMNGLPEDFRSRLTLTTSYLNVVDILDLDITNFDLIGGSVYIPEGQKPYSKFREASGLSTMQLRKKWWDIESKMTQLLADYKDTESNTLFDHSGEVYKEFLEIIRTCIEQLNSPDEQSPYNRFKNLNEEYNKSNPEIPQSEIQEKFLEAYSECYRAVNYINGQDISIVLAAALQNIFIEHNK